MFVSTKIIELGSCAFRQWKAENTHCKYVHGYRLMAKFWFGASELDYRNWVVNFGGLKELKATLQKQFDHTLCIAADDPLLPSFVQLADNGGCQLRVMDGVGIEKTAEWCFKAAKSFLDNNRETKDRCSVLKVEVWEHEDNSAIYEECNKENNKDEEIKEVLTSVTEPQEEVLKSEDNLPKITPPWSGNQAVPVSPPNTSGFSNPFAGTSWARK